MRMHRALLPVDPAELILRRRFLLQVAADVVVAVVVELAPLHPLAVAKAARLRVALEVVAVAPVVVPPPQYPRVAVAGSRVSGIAAFQCRTARR